MGYREKKSFEMTFNVGPAQLMGGVAEDIREAADTGVCSISHRSQRFIQYYRNARTEIFSYFGIPNDWEIYFVGSGSEAMETALRGLTENRSYHHVNGHFSRRPYNFASMIGKNPVINERPDMEGFLGHPEPLPQGCDCAFFTSTETATCVSTGWDYMREFRKANRSAMVVCDVVSVAPMEPLSPDLADLYFFSVQKGVGLPAGMGVILCSPQARDKALYLQKKGLDVGANHCIPTLDEFARKDFTLDTPNVLAIFLLGRVFERFNQKGLVTIQNETLAKSKLIYDWLAKSDIYCPSVANESLRATSVVGVRWRDGVTEEQVLSAVREAHFETGVGYGSWKGSMIRIANFPAHALSDHQALIGALDTVRVEQISRTA